MSGFEIVALVLATPDIVVKIIALGKDISSRIRAVKDPRSMMGDLSTFDRTLLLSAQFEAGRAYCQNNENDSSMRQRLEDNFMTIQKLLLEVQAYVLKVESSSRSHRFWVKNEPKKKLAESSTRLQTLLSDFTDVIQLTNIKDTRPSHLQLSDTDFQWGFSPQRHLVGPGIYCLEGDLAQARNGVQPRHGWFLCERRAYNSGDKATVEHNMRYLSEKLNALPNKMETLDFVGFKDNIDESCFDLVFDLPGGILIEKTLADMLYLSNEKPSLNLRIHLCKQVANAIFQVHEANMVHKSVRSQNLLFFPGVESDIGSDCQVFLVNWHMLRRVDAATQRFPEQDPMMGIYQHPSRQGIRAQEKYNMSHDIYSLGVCMIEILLWLPLVNARPGRPTCLSEGFISELARMGVKPSEIMHEKQGSDSDFEMVSLLFTYERA